MDKVLLALAVLALGFQAIFIAMSGGSGGNGEAAQPTETVMISALDCEGTIFDPDTQLYIDGVAAGGVFVGGVRLSGQNGTIGFLASGSATVTRLEALGVERLSLSIDYTVADDRNPRRRVTVSGLTDRLTGSWQAFPNDNSIDWFTAKGTPNKIPTYEARLECDVS